MEEGSRLDHTLVEFCLKDDALGDPVIATEHIRLMGLTSDDELDQIVDYSLRINDFLSGLFFAIGIRLVDFKLEFGRYQQDGDNIIILADELSPDNCRLWDISTDEKMDKDRFRRDLGGLIEAYSEIARRLGLEMPDITAS
jgi:phosphoribosylaminoimidazole-succinocarboxamide synthase